MGAIFNVRNFNLYTGRYARRRVRPPEKRIGWSVYELLQARMPVLALRRYEEDNWPLVWSRTKSLNVAIRLSLDMLKAWQTFRPSSPKKVIARLAPKVPGIALRFQSDMLSYGVRSVWQARSDAATRERVLLSMCKAVERVSAYKKQGNPMLGSKVLSFLFPDFFPVWDTKWVGKALKNEERRPGNRLPNKIQARFSNGAGRTYASYTWVMLNDMARTSREEYKALKTAAVTYSQLWPDTIDWHYYNLAPILFEICLLGKYYAR